MQRLSLSSLALGLLALLAFFSSAHAALPTNWVNLAGATAGLDGVNTPIVTDFNGNMYAVRLNIVHAFDKSGNRYTFCDNNQKTVDGTQALWRDDARTDMAVFGVTVVQNTNFPITPTKSALMVMICPKTPSSTATCSLVQLSLRNDVTAANAANTNCPFDTVTPAVNMASVSNAMPICVNDNNLKFPLSVDSKTSTVYVGCGSTLRSFAPAGGDQSALIYPGTITSYIGTTNINAVRLDDLVVDSSASNPVVWLLDTNSQAIYAIRIGMDAKYDSVTALTQTGAQSDFFFQSVDGNPNGIAVDKSGNLYISFSGLVNNAAYRGKVFSFNVAGLFSTAAYKAPSAWAYFTDSATSWVITPSSIKAGGPITYDSYNGRLIFNLVGGVYYLPLISVTFTANAAAIKRYTALGAVCNAGDANCFPVVALPYNTASPFTLQLYTSTWPASVTSVSLTSVSGSTGYTFGSTTVSALADVVKNVDVTATSALGSLLVKPALTITASGAASVQYIFSAISPVTAYVQGQISLSAPIPVTTNTATDPFSAGTAMVGVASKYTLTASPAFTPAFVTSCAVPTVTLSSVAESTFSSNTVLFSTSTSTGSVYFTPSRTGPLSNANPPVPTIQAWTGVFSSSCAYTAGSAKVPPYILAAGLGVTPQPTIAFVPIPSFSSDVNPNVQIFVFPPVASDVAFTPLSASVSSVSMGTFLPTGLTVVGNAGSSGVSVYSGFGAMTLGSSAVWSAQFTVVAALQNYYVINSNLNAVAVGSATTATVNYRTPQLTSKVSWNVPNSVATVVNPGQMVGPFIVSIPGSADSVSLKFDDGLVDPVGTFYVVQSTTDNNKPAATGGYLAGTATAAIVKDGYRVWYQAPASNTVFAKLSTGGLLPTSNHALSIAPGTTTTYLAYRETANVPVIRIAGVLSLTSSANYLGLTLPALPKDPLANPAGPYTRFVWSGALSHTPLTLNFGYTLLTDTPIKVTVSQNTPNLDGILLRPTNDATDFTAAQFAGLLADRTVLSLTPKAGTSSIIFFGAGFTTGAIVTFAVTAAVPAAPTGDFANFFIDLNGYNAVAMGQLYIQSSPSTLNVHMQSYFKILMDPVPTADYLLSVTDVFNGLAADVPSNYGTWKLCKSAAALDTCVASQLAPNTNLPAFNLRTAPLETDKTFVLQFTPADNPPAVSAAITAYPAMGFAPRFTLTVSDNKYFFYYPTSLSTSIAGNGLIMITDVDVRNQAVFSNQPILQGSVQVQYVNLDAALGATPTVGALGGANTFQYPLSDDATLTSIPLPMAGSFSPSGTFLAGQRYMIMMTTFPALASTATNFQVSLAYTDGTAANAAGHVFEYNRASSSAAVLVPSVTAAYSTASATFTNVPNAELMASNLDAGLRTVANRYALSCPATALNADATPKCSVGFAFWTVGRIVSGTTPKLTLTVLNSPLATQNNQIIYPAGSMTATVSRWCGVSNSLSTAIATTGFSYGVATRVPAVCTPALSGLPTGSQLRLTEKHSGYGTVYNGAVADTFFTHTVKTASHSAASLGDVTYGTKSYLEFGVYPAVTVGNVVTNPTLLTGMYLTRVMVPVFGTYNVFIKSSSWAVAPVVAPDVAASCSYDTLTRTDLRPEAISYKSTSRVSVCMYPQTQNTGAPVFTDGLVNAGGKNAITAYTQGPNTALVADNGNTYGFVSAAWSAARTNGFNFKYTLTTADLATARFSLCSLGGIPAGGWYDAGVTTVNYGGCGTPATGVIIPAGLTNSRYVSDLEYRTVPTGTPSILAANTYPNYDVFISVTMAWETAANGVQIFPGAAGPFVVGQQYAMILKSADFMNQPAKLGVTVNLYDYCGVLPDAQVTDYSAFSSAYGQWSAYTLTFLPGETSKTVYYTPQRICNTVVAANTGLIFVVKVDTASPDMVARRFAAPNAFSVQSYGAVSVSGIPTSMPYGVTTGPISVSINPPLSKVALDIAVLGDLIVTVDDWYTANAVSQSMGGSFTNTNVLVFNQANSASAQSVQYTSPLSFALDSNGLNAKLSSTGVANQAYLIVPVITSLFNQLAQTAVATPAASQLYKMTFAKDVFDSSVSANGVNPLASIQGVYFNSVAGPALSTVNSALAIAADQVSSFIGKSDVGPTQSASIQFNTAFVSGVKQGYFAAVPFNQSAVVVNVQSTANKIFVSNNGWPNAKSVGGSFGGYILPNALSGYTTPVFFLTPGLNNFLVAAPKTTTGLLAKDQFTFDTATVNDLGSQSGADGDGVVYRFTIARDTITSFAVYVAPANTDATKAGWITVPWISLMNARLPAQFTAAGPNTNLLSPAPGSGVTQNTFTANVDFPVQNIVVSAQFFGTMKIRSTSNVNELGQLIPLANNQMIRFPLSAPAVSANVAAANTQLTVVGGGLGPLTINVLRGPRALWVTGTNIVNNGNMNICITKDATSIVLEAYPNAPVLTSYGVLLIKGDFTYNGGAAGSTKVLQQERNNAINWEMNGTLTQFKNLAAMQIAIMDISTTPVIPITPAQLPITLNLKSYNNNVQTPGYYTGYNNYLLNYCA